MHCFTAPAKGSRSLTSRTANKAATQRSIVGSAEYAASAIALSPTVQAFVHASFLLLLMIVVLILFGVEELIVMMWMQELLLRLQAIATVSTVVIHDRSWTPSTATTIVAVPTM